mmetsp:Transcript_6483/g.12299  ORF Transcript_6483/g.12299 Transcript_6483/m.12299 type:complete len:281 (+) Transcript_6483:129-971(+)
MQSHLSISVTRCPGMLSLRAPKPVVLRRMAVAPTCSDKAQKAKVRKSKKGSANKSVVATKRPGGFGVAQVAIEQPVERPELKYPELDKDVEHQDTAEYFLFVRKIKADKTPGRWLPVGDITIDKEAKVEAAAKERRVLLKEFAQMKYMTLRFLKSGETIEYGSRVQRGPVETDVAYEDAAAIMPLDVDGKIVYTIPANLKLLSDMSWNMKDKKSTMQQDYIAQEKKRQMEAAGETAVEEVLGAPLSTPPAPVTATDINSANSDPSVSRRSFDDGTVQFNF